MSFNRQTSSCLDGIPFVFNEHIKRIIQIQSSFQKPVVKRSDVLDLSTFTYDLSVENKYLSKQDEERRKEADILELEKQFQLFVDAHKNKVLNNAAITTSTPPPTTTTSQVPAEAAPSFSWNSSIHPSNESQRHFSNQTFGNEILIPCRPEPGKCFVERTTDGTKMSAIDLKDFEREHDPFENVSLKVINDIEELDKVLKATNQLSRSTLPEVSNFGNGFYGQKEQIFTRGSTPNGACVPTVSTTSGPHLPVQTQNSDHWWSNDSNHIGVSEYSTSYFPANQVGQGGNNNFYAQQSLHQQKQQIPNNSSTISKNNHSVNGTHQNYNLLPNFQQNSINMENIATNFYFNKYQTTTTTSSTTTSTGVTTPLDQPIILSSNLRHAKSTPDITTPENILEHSGMSKQASPGVACNYFQNLNAYGRYTPPLYHGKTNDERLINSSTHKTPSSLLHHHQQPSSLHQQSSSLHHHQPSSSSLHHHQPSSSSSTKDKETVIIDKLCKFGHKRNLIVEFVKRFGADEDKIQSHLRCIQEFVSKGHDPMATEKCFLHLDNIPEQAERYSKVFGIFHVMGFPFENIHRALEISNLEEELTLNILTQQ